MSTHESKALYMATLGCPKNRVDSEVMLGTLGARGYRLVQRARPRPRSSWSTPARSSDRRSRSRSTPSSSWPSSRRPASARRWWSPAACPSATAPSWRRRCPRSTTSSAPAAYVQIGDLLAAEAAPRQVIPDPDYVHDARDAEGQLQPEVDRVPQDLRGLRQRLRLLHHPHAPRRAALAAHRRHRRRGAHAGRQRRARS